MKQLHVWWSVLVLAAPAASAAETYYFNGSSADGRELTVTLTIDGNSARVQALHSPGTPGAQPGTSLFTDGPVTQQGESVTVHFKEGSLAFTPAAPGALNGTAQLRLGGQQLGLTQVGSAISGSLASPDGLFQVAATLPFFSAEPWAGVLLFDGLELGRIWQEGLEQRAFSPVEPRNIWTFEEHVTLFALSEQAISALKTTYMYMGGAHPNTFRASHNLVSDGRGGWTETARLCEAVTALGWTCDEAKVRDLVIAELAEQGAEWVLSFELTAEEPWLLEVFVLGPDWVTVVFDPYAAGPYVQGPFFVDLDYASLAD